MIFSDAIITLTHTSFYANWREARISCEPPIMCKDFGANRVVYKSLSLLLQWFGWSLTMVTSSVISKGNCSLDFCALPPKVYRIWSRDWLMAS